MTLASLGWGCWWLWLFVRRFAPDWSWSVATTAWFAGPFGAAGLLLAFLTLRAGRTWLLFSAVAFLANAGLLFLPWIVGELRD